MINIRKVFSNKHRAYLLIFVCAYLVLRLPILISNKIERVIMGKIGQAVTSQGFQIAFQGFKFSFPGDLKYDQLLLSKPQSQSILLENVAITTAVSYPFKVNFDADIFKGKLSCNFTKGLFSSELGLNCNANNFETSEISIVRDLSINGPISFKFTGTSSPNENRADIKGEFLSQLDGSKIKLPKEIPSIVKVPNLGLLDLKGNFRLVDSNVSIEEFSVASTMGDLDGNLNADLSPGFKEVLKLEALLNLKLSSAGIQAIAPWVGLALGGVEYPASGQAKIEVKGNTRARFRGTLVGG